MYYTMYPWNWAERPARVQFSPRSSSVSSQEGDSVEGDSVAGFKTEHNKRGRPRAEQISTLILEGAGSTCSIRCKICSRVFPREKSLQAHLRTHTGERPYLCDYPGCGKSFCQSGQMKTHQRLHTGEKPFICSFEGCTSRFTHANRHCPEHPYANLRRVPTPPKDSHGLQTSTQSVSEWLARQSEEKMELGIDVNVPTAEPETRTSREPETSQEPETRTSWEPEKRMSREPVKVHQIDIPQAPVVQEMDTTQNSTIFVKPKTVERKPLSHRPFKKEQKDKWVSALALLELSQGVS